MERCPRSAANCRYKDGKPNLLWHEQDLSEDQRFDFDKAMVLRSDWCATHGKQYLKDIVRYDE